MYKHKYLKYKNKYTQLRGGAYKENIEKEKIENEKKEKEKIENEKKEKEKIENEEKKKQDKENNNIMIQKLEEYKHNNQK
jgi:hypothetical protein